jgi:hypothetical protein
MDEEQIKTILQQADRTACVVRISTDLAQRVQQKAARRRMIRMVVVPGAAAAMIVVAVGVEMWGRIGTAGKAAPPTVAAVGTGGKQADVEKLRREIRELKLEVDTRMAMLEQVLARQEQKNRLAQAQRKLAAMKDPLVEVKEQLDKAAFIIVYQADRKYNELDLKESAIADYRQVIKLYPQTMWAEKAQERLNGIDQIGDLL